MAEKEGNRFYRTLRTQFFAGLLTTIPVGGTILILWWLYNTIDNLLRPIIDPVTLRIWERTFPGIGFVITILLIYIIGVIASNYVGKKLIKSAESIFPALPVVRQIYNTIKEILGAFSQPGESGLLQVVLVEFPKKGMKSIGFITNEIVDHLGRKQYAVFIPNTPNPATGNLEIMGEDEIIRTDISVENAMKMLVSAGRVSPKKVSQRPWPGTSVGL